MYSICIKFLLGIGMLLRIVWNSKWNSANVLIACTLRNYVLWFEFVINIIKLQYI
jgi:hypothetical protein